jgi:hypothetical protein
MKLKKELIILLIILTSLSGCSILSSKVKFVKPECPQAPDCSNANDKVECWAYQKQSYKACINLHNKAWDKLNEY